MNKDVFSKIGDFIQARGKQVRTADWPETITQKFFGDTVRW
jgi:hypothetical protein